MFSVIFEVHPRAEQWNAYLDHARMLRPDLEQVEGFVDNIRYRSLTRDGWILSLSNWRDEKSLIRWRTHARHHDVQAQGRTAIFSDYHLRVGQVTRDTDVPAGQTLLDQRRDETEVGDGTTVTLINAARPQAGTAPGDTASCAAWLGLTPWATGSTSWDIFEAVLTPGDLILLVSWRDDTAADTYETAMPVRDRARVRRIRVIRDYGMFDRREAPQFYPDAKRGNGS
jgi:heme-degrading monooxygenase HmoA